MAYELLIRRRPDQSPIGRHTWVSFALNSPALLQLTIHSELPQHQSLAHPAFGLCGHWNRPLLFWRDGEVIVKDATDEYLSDLVSIAARLAATLVHTDGTDIDGRSA